MLHCGRSEKEARQAAMSRLLSPGSIWSNHIAWQAGIGQLTLVGLSS